jgi:predicted PurR-regulated permease PerM
LIYQARRPLTALIFAILLAYLLDPLVARFQTYLRGSRALAIAATYILMGVAVAALRSRLGPEFSERLKNWYENCRR